MLWGVDGGASSVADLILVKVTVKETDVRLPFWRSMESAIWLLGREIVATVRGRRAVRPGRGVTFRTRAPTFEVRKAVDWIGVPDGTVFRIKDVPRMALPYMEAALEGHGSLVALP